ncbi:biotin--[acetyl-CoA-carboxylase] ligase [Segetibacter koreensis]|uniref:biotin--[acetyl-CoA-carboxylase] ligase n=1 Tax=Segetibacter koreensis TaxID=398037 RepID=UPI000366A2CF|nr:biotin--[acetyl-CoA-carboxylase] ligase [Segetibacter koreensis]
MRPENPIGEPFFELCEVDSTNNYAMRQVQAQMAVHGATWFAQYQNAGKGQRGKAWKAVHGENIIMSTVLEPAFLGIDNQFLLNVTVALACFDLFNKYTIDETSIKWPNDIYWRDRKAGGMLIENVLKGKEWKFSIAGLGININQTFFPADLPNPVSLKQITGKSFNVTDLAKELCQCLDYRWKQLKEQKDNDLLQEYSSHLYKLDEMVTFKKDGSIFNAVVTGVSRNGELLVKTDRPMALTYGSVNWIIPQPK